MSKLIRFGAIAAACAAIFVTGTADAQQCVTEKAKSALTTCPGGKFQANVTKRPQVSFSTAPEGIKKKDRTTDLKPINPTDITKTAQRDERAARLKPKVRKLLITEIANVERLYKNTPKNDKDRPQLLRRLAEGYVELESSAFRDKVESETKAQNLRKKDPKRAAAFKKEAEKANKIIKAARKNAIKYYTTLKDGYPKWCQFPNNPPAERGCGDEVLYYLAYEHEQAGDLDNARKVYLELTENWKQSKYVPNAYLAFGELFFNEAQGDPTKWPVAANFYKEVLKYEPPDNKLWGYAAYKLGYVWWNQGEYGKSIDEFKKVIEFGQKFGQLPNASGLAKSARRDIIPVYALAGKPERAFEFFKPLAGDSAGSDEQTYGMMEDLGQNLLDTGHYPEAIVLYNDLIKRRPRSPEVCTYQARVTECIMASQGGTKPPIVAALEKQLDQYKQFQSGSYGPDAKVKCANETASLMTETAMAWHLEAVGSGGVRGTGDAKTMDAAEQLYKLVVDNFTSDQFRAFKFPRIVKEDWPTIPKIQYARADLLYFQKKWKDCGPAFDAVVAEDPNGPNAAEAAFASVLCYENIYAELHADGSHRKGTGELPGGGPGKEDPKKKKGTEADKFKPKDFTEQQKGMITAFNRYVCYIKPPEGDRDALEQYVEVKYARARTYFEAQHWEEAAWAFRDVALNYPQMDASIYAAQLYLEALNVLGSRVEPKKPECYEPMKEDVPKFIDSYCQGKKKDENEEQCGVLFRIQRDIERLQAENLVKACDEKPGPECIKRYEEAGNLYFNMWKKYGEEPCEKNQKEACAKNDEVLYNAARAFQAARLIAKAINVRKILISPKYNLHETEAARKAVYEIGGNYQAIAVYELAAEWYEKFAEENPKMEKAPDALSDAVVLRLGLGQHEKAIEDADKFNKQYGAKAPAKAAQIAFAIGAHHAERSDWDKAQKALSGAMRLVDANATVDVKMQAHALLGRVLGKLGKDGDAEREYGKVRDSWKDPAAMKAELDKQGGTQDQKLRRLAKTLTAVGEALYFFAEKKRVAAEAFKFPAYKGDGKKDDVQKFIQNDVKKWLDQKKPALEEAEGEYLKILKLQPAPPPRWVIAAGAAVGGMWGEFVNDFRRAPYPKDWDQKGFVPGIDPPLLWEDLKASYLASLDEASEGQKQRAKGAYLKCLDYSVQYQYFDEDSRSCETWLSKNYPGEFHAIDEFKDDADRVSSGLDERAQALTHDGSPVVIDTREAEESASAKEGKSATEK
jgi:TolA-binding protein